MRKIESILYTTLTYLLLVVILVCTIYPLYWMSYAGTFTPAQLPKFVAAWKPGDQLSHNYELLKLAFSIVRVMGNTAFVALVGTFFSLLVNLMMGYALAKYEFRFKNALFTMFVMTVFIGGAAAMIPQFEIIMKLGLYNNLFAIILPAIYSPYLAFLARQTMLDFPNEIMQAGRIDGCGEFEIFFKLALPNMKAIIATIGIISFMGYWNGYLWNLIVTSSVDQYTLQVALASIYPKAGLWPYAPLRMLGATISIVPILTIFIFMQKYFVNSITGAVKG